MASTSLPLNLIRLVPIVLALGVPAKPRVAGLEYEPPPVECDDAAILSDTAGAISELLLHYHPGLHGELDTLYRDLFAALPPEVNVTVACPSLEAMHEFQDTWGSAATTGGRTLRLLDAEMPLSVWARDRLIARADPDLGAAADSFVPVCGADYDGEKANDLDLAFLLEAAGLGPGIIDSQLQLEGGNVVANERHAFVGADALTANAHLDTQEFGLELQRVLGREAVLLGDPAGAPPWYHVDMYLTPIGEDVILLADPKLGTELVLGEAARDACIWGEISPLEPALCAEVCARLDVVAEQLRLLGYRIWRLPALMGVDEEWMVSYCNVLLDRRGDQDIVYLPVYRIPELDSVAYSIYRALGFEVRTIDVSAMLDMGGALRCLANVTQRRLASDIPAAREATAHLYLFDTAGDTTTESLLLNP